MQSFSISSNTLAAQLTLDITYIVLRNRYL